MASRGRARGALRGGLVFSFDWLVVIAVVAGVLSIAIYALGALAGGQSEWFGREERRRDERARRT